MGENYILRGHTLTPFPSFFYYSSVIESERNERIWICNPLTHKMLKMWVKERFNYVEENNSFEVSFYNFISCSFSLFLLVVESERNKGTEICNSLTHTLLKIWVKGRFNSPKNKVVCVFFSFFAFIPFSFFPFTFVIESGRNEKNLKL